MLQVFLVFFFFFLGGGGGGGGRVLVLGGGGGGGGGRVTLSPGLLFCWLQDITKHCQAHVRGFLREGYLGNLRGALGKLREP